MRKPPAAALPGTCRRVPSRSVVLLTDTRRPDCQISCASCFRRNTVKNKTLCEALSAASKRRAGTLQDRPGSPTPAL
jgi:hypothetical protein